MMVVTHCAKTLWILSLSPSSAIELGLCDRARYPATTALRGAAKARLLKSRRRKIAGKMSSQSTAMTWRGPVVINDCLSMFILEMMAEEWHCRSSLGYCIHISLMLVLRA